MAKFDSAALETEIVEALKRSGRAATYVIRNRLDWPGKKFHKTGLETRHVLTACRRLERRGLIAEEPSSYSVMKTWRAA